MNSSEAAVDTFPYFAIVKMYRRSIRAAGDRQYQEKLFEEFGI